MPSFILCYLIKLLPILSFSFLALNSQSQNTQRIYYDTIELKTPKLAKEDLASPEDYKHCIDLTENIYKIVIAGEIYYLANKQKLIEVIKKNKAIIVKHPFNIISNMNSDYSRIILVLDIMEKEKIKNYRLLSTSGTLPPIQIISESKTPFPKDIDLSDSSVFVILAINDTTKVSLLGQKNIFNRLEELELFIISHQSVITASKIVLTAPADTKYATINPILELLKKYKYYNYHLTEYTR